MRVADKAAGLHHRVRRRYFYAKNEYLWKKTLTVGKCVLLRGCFVGRLPSRKDKFSGVKWADYAGTTRG